MKKELDELSAIRKFTGDDSLKFIGPDDTFDFKCQQCGKCCMNRTDIIINPFDVYNGAKYLGIAPIEFVTKYCFPDLGGNSKIPMVLLATSENGFCPLLKFDVKDGGKFKCMIHPVKPGACANHPIGVTYALNKETGESTMRYIKVQQCSNSTSDEQHVVKDWVKPYIDNQSEIDMAHKIQHLATDYFNPRKFWFLLTSLNRFEKEDDRFEKELVIKAFNKYMSSTIAIGYVNYDINRPFIEQAEENIKELGEFYAKTKDIYDDLTMFFKEFSGKDFDEYFDEFEKSMRKGEVENDNNN